MPRKHEECVVCGQENISYCSRCRKVICEEHVAWITYEEFDTWESAEKYCEACWAEADEFKEAQDLADQAKEKWLKGGTEGGVAQ